MTDEEYERKRQEIVDRVRELNRRIRANQEEINLLKRCYDTLKKWREENCND